MTPLFLPLRSLALGVALLGAGTLMAQERSEVQLRQWDFRLEGQAWQAVRTPHDWAISGPFDENIDLQFSPIEQNGETTESRHSGRSGALPWIGNGEYRTTFQLPKVKGRVWLTFDGAMAEPVVYVNGHEAGSWPYGYNAFRLDVTQWVKAGSNEVRVALTNRPESSRWYPGAGLYRPVTLTVVPACHIDTWQSYFRTLQLEAGAAACVACVATQGADHAKGLMAVAELMDHQGRVVASGSQPLGSGGKAEVPLRVEQPRLWSPESPYLYTLRTAVKEGSRVADATESRVGLRTVAVTAEGGFMLNGISRKLKGVNLHHDLGPLGAALNKAALIRQIRMMKDMGADAIRTSHNMPSQMQMEICDSMGMMVMAESFDAWHWPKVANGYNRWYDEWWQRDLENLLLHHRNHPSIVMWSIGNEIPEHKDAEGAARAQAMTDLCHSLDPTRTVTCGCDHPDKAAQCGFFSALDVPGFNYRVHLYEPVFPQLRQGFLLGSETASTLSSRGVYKFPVSEGTGVTYPDGQCSSYDVEYCWWSNLPDDDFRVQTDLPYTIGQFVWTGFDYLGEPTPYDAYWPSRSSYFGAVDLAGLPKDRYYLYRSVWNRQAHTLHMLPHWTWPGREGEVTPVYVYTDYPEAELFVNGRSQGRRTKQDTARLDRFRLRWNEVVYEPGTVKVVAYDATGHAADSLSVSTAGTPSTLHLEADRTVLTADGDDLAFVTVQLHDAAGTFCPTLSDELTFEVSGAGSFQAVCNGDATSTEVFTEPHMHLFSGQLVVVVRSGTQPGPITLTVRDAARNLSQTLTLQAR